MKKRLTSSQPRSSPESLFAIIGAAPAGGSPHGILRRGLPYNFPKRKIRVMTASCEDGFTLVELSIVLVIIGLLIGGILAAQSMISTAKVNAVAMQIGQFDAGVENFKTKYNYLPGDAPSFGGNGDGLMEGYNPANNATADNRIFSGEMANFWYDFDQQQFPSISGINYSSLPGVMANISGSNRNVPESKLGKAHSFFIASANAIYNNSDIDVASPKNYYVLLDPTQLQTPSGQYYLITTSASNNNQPVKAADLQALDSKIDDSLANSGNVLSGSICTDTSNPYLNAGSAHSIPLNDTTCTITQMGSAYNLTNTNFSCTPFIRIGASAGDPQ